MRMGVWAVLASFALAGCNQSETKPAATNQNKPVTAAKPAIGEGETPAGATTEPVKPDNTAVNQRDRDNKTVLPTDQGNDQADIDRTAQIRSRIVDNKDMSIKGRNVKIITLNGKVTLRGPVASEAERKTIEDIARAVAGTENVTSELEIAP